MNTSHPASLLVAALVMLRHPCARNKAAARLLLERAAEHTKLTPVERETCLTLADDLDIECSEPAVVRPLRSASPRPATDRGAEHRCLSLVPGLSSAPAMKGISA